MTPQGLLRNIRGIPDELRHVETLLTIKITKEDKFVHLDS